MSYQALARKWRPRNFGELIGQSHVVNALGNALAQGRLHHAYLLTGTRGVGKTTIARIFAKSLNCLVNGVSATPCGECAACADIDAGRFVDLLELDAASHTGIDNMREILDNARYAPTTGRYKVYLIDEVHMLSKQAFNSMLKTLEEPPEHVKFVLATTDAQRIPVTVLSRCLQFHLRALPPALIGERLTAIVGAEGIGAEPAALALIARAARGSMRDALSLLDQAIAGGGDQVREAAVRAMVGAADARAPYRIVDALLAADGRQLLAEAAAMTEQGAALDTALDELASLFHRIAVAQVVPGAAEVFDDAAEVAAYAGRISAELVQVAYQICAQGRADLPLAPDEATGFTMTLLRLLAFEPGSAPPRLASENRSESAARASPAPRRALDATDAAGRAELTGAPSAANLSGAERAPDSPAVALPEDAAGWPPFIADLKLPGIAGQLAGNSVLVRREGAIIVLAVAPAHQHLLDPGYVDKLRAALERATGKRVKLAFEIADLAAETSLAAKEERERAADRAKLEARFASEPFVKEALARFDGTIRPGSVRPETPGTRSGSQ